MIFDMSFDDMAKIEMFFLLLPFNVNNEVTIKLLLLSLMIVIIKCYLCINGISVSLLGAGPMRHVLSKRP